MIFHLSEYIKRGRIDNRTRGVVLLELFLRGRKQPVCFRLAGDCMRDLAGCLAEFSLLKAQNVPDNIAQEDFFSLEEEGLVGDMTASKRTLPRETGRGLSNQLYLEWFTPRHGMFLLEINNAKLNVSLSEWSMDTADEQAQIMCNQQALRDYVAAWIDQYAHYQDDPDPLPDSRWDIRLREAEASAIAFQEIHRKYRMELFAETRESFVMGWDKVLGDLAAADENGTMISTRISGALSLFDILNDDEAIDAQLGMSHPLFQQIMKITETTQRLFARFISPGRRHRGAVCQPDVPVLFMAIRYITPNTLSCLLQLNEDHADYQVLAQKLSRCAERVSQALQAIHQVKVRGGKRLVTQLETLHQDLISMMHDLSKQGKR